MTFTLFQPNKKAKSAEVNANFAFVSGDRLIAIDPYIGGAKGTFEIGDLTATTNGSLAGDLNARTGSFLNVHNSSGTLINRVSYDDLLNLQSATETQEGTVRLSTQSQADNGTDDSTALTPLKFKNSTFTNRKLLITSTASSDSTIDFTGLSSDYSRYVIEFNSIKMGNDGVRIDLRMSGNNGASYDSGTSDYDWICQSPNRWRYESNDSKIELVDDSATSRTLSNAAGDYANGTIEIANPTLSSSKCVIFFQMFHKSASGNVTFNIGSGARKNAKAINAIRLLPSAGVFSSGTFKLYGIK
tara:strand:+ start:244 stop:1146 length:903 start_codon:yes stop_codon:yes gene_type:complete